MSPPRVRQLKLMAEVVFWLALGVGLGIAFGDSLGQALVWLAVAVAIGLVLRARRQIAAAVARRRRSR